MFAKILTMSTSSLEMSKRLLFTLIMNFFFLYFGNLGLYNDLKLELRLQLRQRLEKG